MTVLFCDLAGYARLSHEPGAEAVHAMTGRFFGVADGLIERFGGTIDKFWGGSRPKHDPDYSGRQAS